MAANYEEPMEQREQHEACINVAESRQRKSKNHFAQRIRRYEEGKKFFREGKKFFEERKMISPLNCPKASLQKHANCLMTHLRHELTPIPSGIFFAVRQ
ncbi:MAG: hypothetical protein IK000_07140 [Bacteroidaceae bacterium]|nr:hypothetical protein [Bacteroidaceae bacterium]